MASRPITLSGDAKADALLSASPLALLIGLVLDQQVPLEWAFKSPYELAQRLGHEPGAPELAAMDPDQLASIFSRPPALHRFPGSMSKRVQSMCQVLVDSYEGRADQVWNSVKTGEELFKNIKALPGFGDQKARIFVAFLAKQMGVRPPGWESFAGPYGESDSFRSIADIVGPESLAKVRKYKAEMKAKAKPGNGA